MQPSQLSRNDMPKSWLSRRHVNVAGKGPDEQALSIDRICVQVSIFCHDHSVHSPRTFLPQPFAFITQAVFPLQVAKQKLLLGNL
jgi:hypothetical protein